MQATEAIESEQQPNIGDNSKHEFEAELEYTDMEEKLLLQLVT